MASKTVPAKKKSTTAINDNAQEPIITTIKKSTSKNLQGTATLTYHIGLNDTSALCWKIHANSGNGMFSSEWVAFADIQQTLDMWPKDSPITSMALYPLFNGKSVNTPSFLLATLVKEGILEVVPGKKRHYQLGDAKAFLAEVDKLKAAHSKPSKAKPRAKAKAATRMPTGKAKPATGK
jgi:hypothetical protein